MNKKKIIPLLFFIFLLLGTFLVPILADAGYGIKDESVYVWNVTEDPNGTPIQYRLTTRFNLKQNRAEMTKYFYANGSSVQFNMQMNQIQHFIVAFHERHGQHDYFYTGPGALNFPRHVLIVEDSESTQITDYQTGITLYYSSELEEHELISGNISVTWFVWLILGITISLSVLSIILIYKRGKPQHNVLVYGNATNM